MLWQYVEAALALVAIPLVAVIVAGWVSEVRHTHDLARRLLGPASSDKEES